MTQSSAGLYVVMGVAGSGKSLIGSALARALGLDFVEGMITTPLKMLSAWRQELRSRTPIAPNGFARSQLESALQKTQAQAS